MNGDWIGQCNRVARVGRSVSRAPSRSEGDRGLFISLKTHVMAPMATHTQTASVPLHSICFLFYPLSA